VVNAQARERREQAKTVAVGCDRFADRSAWLGGGRSCRQAELQRAFFDLASTYPSSPPARVRENAGCFSACRENGCVGRRGRPRIATDEETAEVARLRTLGVPMRAVARRVFGDAALKDRVARIIEQTPPQALELSAADEKAIWEELVKITVDPLPEPA
jgi:hypothetical protein